MAGEPGLTPKAVRHRSRRFHRRRRIVFGVALGLLAVLLIANVYFIFGRSPGRMKVRYLQDGFRAYDLGRYEEARLNFERYVRIDPDRSNLWYMLGLSCLQLGLHDDGVPALERAVRLRPGFTHAHTALSEHWRSQGQLLRALRSAERATAGNPVPDDAWVALGEARLALGEIEGAIEAFRQAVQVNPMLVDTLLKLADLYFSREKLGLQDLSAGLARKRYEQAALLAQQLLTADPGNVQARVWRAKASAGQGFLSEALDDLVLVVDLEPKVAAHRLLLARFQEATQSYEDAVVTLRESFERTPDPAIAVLLAGILTDRLSEPEAGRLALEAGIERFPDEAGLQIALAAHLTRRGELSLAQEVLTRALAEFPGDSLVFEAAADLALKQGDGEGAASALREALVRFEMNLSARRKLIGLLLDEYLGARKRGEPVEALRTELDQHLAFFLHQEKGVNPTDLLARSCLARLYFDDGRFEDAAQLLDQEGGGVPRSYDGLKILALARLSSGDHEGASDSFLAALRHPSCPRTFEDFNLAYTTAFRIGRIPREVEIVRAALESWPKDADWRIRLATSLYRGRSFTEAVAECELAKTLLAGRRDVRPYLLAARIHQAAGEKARARAELEAAVQVRPDAETRGALYRFLSETGEEQLGEAGFRALIEENPADPGVYLDLGDFLLARSGKIASASDRARKLRQEALAHYQTALSLDPDSRDARRRMAELRLAQAGSREEAVSVAEEAVAKIVAADGSDPQVQYFRGKLHLLRKEYSEALAALSQYARSRPNDAAGHYYLGIACRHTGDLDRARSGFLAALGLDPTMGEAKLELATLYFTEGMRANWSGQLEQARTAFDKVLEIDPRQPDAHRFSAEALAGLGLLDGAAIHAAKVLEEIPDDPGALFLSGLFKARQGLLGEAQEQFEHLVSVAPENPRAHLYLGMVLAERRQTDQALEVLRRAHELEPEGDDVLRTIALTELSAGRLEQAIAFVLAERARFPQRAFVQQLLGELYFHAERPEEGIELCRRAFELAPENPAPLAVAAVARAGQGRFPEAIEMLRSGMESAGRPAVFFLLSGQFQVRLGEREEAELAFREALRRDPETLLAYRELGSLLLDDGRTEEGREMFEEAVDRGTRDPETWFRLGWLEELRGEDDRAVELYRRALGFAPDHPATLNNLAMVLVRSPDTVPEAVAVAQRAREAKPKDPYIADTLGFVLLMADRIEEALPLLLEAAEALPQNAEVQHNAGMACFRNYRWDDARRLLKNALRLEPESATAEEAREALRKIR